MAATAAPGSACSSPTAPPPRAGGRTSRRSSWPSHRPRRRPPPPGRRPPSGPEADMDDRTPPFGAPAATPPPPHPHRPGYGTGPRAPGPEPPQTRNRLVAFLDVRQGGGRFTALDGYRALACIAVLIYHVAGYSGMTTGATSLATFI